MQSIRPWRPCRLVAVLRMPYSELLWSVRKYFVLISQGQGIHSTVAMSHCAGILCVQSGLSSVDDHSLNSCGEDGVASKLSKPVHPAGKQRLCQRASRRTPAGSAVMRQQE